MNAVSTNIPANAPDTRSASIPDHTGMMALRQIGFWSALATALCGFCYGLAVIIMVVSNLSSSESPAGWQGINAYLAAFRPIHLLPLYPSLLLAPAFSTLMVCVHYYAAQEKRIWSHIALVHTTIYAGMALINYTTQLLSIQRAVVSGETDGLSMLVFGNPHAVFWSLASAYVFMNLAMLFAAPVFSGGRLEQRIQRLFLLNGFSVIVTVASLLVDNPFVFLLVSLVVWWPLFTAAMVLLVMMFRRLNQTV